MLGMRESQAHAPSVSVLRGWYVVTTGRIPQHPVRLTYMAAIKSRIFGQLNWSIRRPTVKQVKVMAREEREDKRRARTIEADPRKEKEEQIVKHTGWKR